MSPSSVPTPSTSSSTSGSDPKFSGESGSSGDGNGDVDWSGSGGDGGDDGGILDTVINFVAAIFSS